MLNIQAAQQQFLSAESYIEKKQALEGLVNLCNAGEIDADALHDLSNAPITRRGDQVAQQMHDGNPRLYVLIAPSGASVWDNNPLPKSDLRVAGPQVWPKINVKK
ncbi:MAG: hypothetical protein AAGD32_06395 [Planctomycetota bacterium]